MVSMDTLVSLCKRRGFVFPSSEIYGGFGSTWDYGPLGVELKRNIREAWWQANVYTRDDIVGLDAAILMHPRTWEASGHVQNFSDPMVDCKNCKMRFRADHVEGTVCPNCGGELTEARMFNLMFKTFVGPVEEEAAVAYFRPETAQGIFVNFKNVLNTTRRKLPFGIAQIGKSFRNEITPGNFIFRTREFEQMEIEYFVKPGTDEEWYERWVAQRLNWYLGLGLKRENLRLRLHEDTERAHYAAGATDVEYQFPFGWSELEGIANRTDYDLKRHAEFSGQELDYFDDESGERFVPYVIEPSAGVDRSLLAFLVDAYDEEPDKEGTRVVLRLHKALAPYKVAILPLSRKEPLVLKAKEVWAALRPHFATSYDDAQSIGRRYRRQDETGTPLCVTIDFETLNDDAVTIRDRDSMQQVRVPVAELRARLADLLTS
ncbi:MAG: glycine--tRNA ligase [Chloroflexi bacterium]|nr:glycine--tRNA ligase [Chloroflexota bacterium]MCL5110331.1 glycine--tRNA ligase [Chloroflexota bacterium]